jgi:hypothetical protein
MHQYPQTVAPSTATHCTAPGCRIDPNSHIALVAKYSGGTVPARLAVDGTDLCNWHHSQFKKLLGELVSSWPDLESALYRRGGGTTNDRVQTSGIVDLSQSWNPDASETMSAIAEWTDHLVRTVVRYFPLQDDVTQTRRTAIVDVAAAAPDGFTWGDGKPFVFEWTETKTTTRTHTIATVRGTRLQLSVIAQHYAHWLSSYPGVGPALLADVYEHAYAVKKAITAPTVRRVRFGAATCGTTVVDTELGEISCMAPMVAVFPLEDDDRPSVMMCTVHPKTHTQFTKEQFMEWAL